LSGEEKPKDVGGQVKEGGESTGAVAAGVGVEELEKLIREAPELPYVSKDLRENKLCIQWGKRKVKCVQYDPRLEEYLRPIAEEVRASMKGKPLSTGMTSTSDVGIWMASVKGRKPLVEHLVEHLKRRQQVILEFGARAMLAVLMASGVPADKIGEFVHRFENEPDSLVNFLLDKLENFIVAATSQQDLAKCREDVTERDAIIAYLESEYEKLYNNFVNLSNEVARIRRKYNMIASLLKIATTIMPKDRLRMFANVATAMVLEHGGEHTASVGGAE
jgi:hypothetical protein